MDDQPMINGNSRPAKLCDNCSHFHRYEPDKPTGCCHAMPPTPILVGMIKHPISGAVRPHVDGFWAPTNEAEVCGHHQYGTARTHPVATADEVAAALAGIKTEGSA